MEQFTGARGKKIEKANEAFNGRLSMSQPQGAVFFYKFK